MKLSEFHYELPRELIAQQPSERRDDSRLMVVERASGNLVHARFKDLPQFLVEDELLVLNNSRVFPARLFGRRKGRQERIEVLLLRRAEENTWEVLARPARKLSRGTILVFDEEGQFAAETVGSFPSSPRRLLRFNQSGGPFWGWIDRLGHTPLPPYIRRPGEQESSLDRERYQTVYARVRGSVAAPTAGLHFTPELLQKIPHCEITLHVGYGTFQPVQCEQIEEHRLESEYYEVGREAAARIQSQQAARKRVVAVGTTTTRALETVARKWSCIREDRGWTDLYIYPGFSFRVVGGLVTNFHLPGSSLLLLVSAFAGIELIRKAYREAVERRYRFYSYGDAMLIL